jgi:NhaP-type Na+/H+ or K+/H+ antiporter
MISEELNFSGIIAIFCCGFTMNHYTYYNLSEDSQNGSVLAIQTMSHFSEAATYAFLGFSVFSIHGENASLLFMLILVGITIIARLVSVAVPILLLRVFSKRRLDYKQ